MGFGLLFVPLMGGYLFLASCNSTRFLVRRQSGHHLLLRSASVGLVLLAISRPISSFRSPARSTERTPGPSADATVQPVI